MNNNEKKLREALQWMIRVYVDDYRKDGFPLTIDENAAYVNALRVIAQTEEDAK
jgi:hypothetical protein